MAINWHRLARPRLLLWVLLGVSAIVGAGFAWAVIRSDYKATLTQQSVAVRHLTQVLDDSLGRALENADLMLRLASAGMLSNGEWVPMDGPRVSRLKSLLTAAPYLDDLYLVDRHGRVVADAKGRAAPGQSLATEDWVRAVLGGAAETRYVGPMAVDPLSGDTVFPMARPLFDDDGQIAGAVAVTLKSAYFGPHDDYPGIAAPVRIGIYRLDGAILAMLPQGAVPALPRLSPSSTETLQIRPGDGGEMLVASLPVPDFPLVVAAGVDLSAAWSQWRMRALVAGAITLMLFALVAGLIIATHWALRRDSRAMSALRAANRELSRSNSDLESFAYVASHDLKEPLRNIASYVQLLQRRYQGRLDADADAFIGYTVDGVRRMQMIINELLSYSRIGTGPLSRAQVATGVLVSAALSQLKTAIAEAGAVVEIKGPLPVVAGDAAQLGSVFQNLIANAIKYRREDVRPELFIGATDAGENWRFSVRDNGIGIDAQYHGQIFELFKRLHTRDRYSGTGIGLAVCQRVIERHGGEIWVDSEVGKGTTFFFLLPKTA